MKEFNLIRLMNSCRVTIDSEYYDELYDHLLDTEVDLNELNIDDLVVDGVKFIESGAQALQDFYVLKETDTGCWVL